MPPRRTRYSSPSLTLSCLTGALLTPSTSCRSLHATRCSVKREIGHTRFSFQLAQVKNIRRRMLTSTGRFAADATMTPTLILLGGKTGGKQKVAITGHSSKVASCIVECQKYWLKLKFNQIPASTACQQQKKPEFTQVRTHDITCSKSYRANLFGDWRGSHGNANF